MSERERIEREKKIYRQNDRENEDGKKVKKRRNKSVKFFNYY